jgi:LemA protein
MIGGLVFLAIVGIAVVSAVVLYNGLVSLRNRWRNAFGQIDVQLRRRYDLVPNLVETAKAYLKHERETLEAVVRARNAAAGAAARAAAAPGDAQAMAGLAGAEATLAGTLSRFVALAEAYPDLKANQTMASLMEELSSTENRIAFARQAFNDAVMEYNTARETFPGVLVARQLGFGPASGFEIVEPVQRDAVKVAF